MQGNSISLKQTASAGVCPLRFHHFQKLCESLNLDGLLFIAGLDSKYNLGSHQALTYLFQSHTPWTPVDTPKLPAHLQDLVLVLTPSRVKVWAPGDSLEPVYRALGDLREVTEVFGTVAEDEEDEDVGEDCKIGGFVQMMKGLKSIGVPFFGDVEAAIGVETWPLVQAYGLDGVGKDGFFTQNFQVCREMQRIFVYAQDQISVLKMFVADLSQSFALAESRGVQVEVVLYVDCNAVCMQLMLKVSLMGVPQLIQ